MLLVSTIFGVVVKVIDLKDSGIVTNQFFFVLFELKLFELKAPRKAKLKAILPDQMLSEGLQNGMESC